jgi:hypothetical protein
MTHVNDGKIDDQHQHDACNDDNVEHDYTDTSFDDTYDY